jgi:malate dehydrogenase (oxaloacetate-decarboxylating)(NADP+)
MYLPITAKGHLRGVLSNWPRPDVRFIVVTDGERILGLGDLGVGGMGIPIGKLALYTACAGVPPRLILPITLDVGTNNHALLEDPLYLGLRQNRTRGAEYDAFIDEFVRAVRDLFPKCCLQWEDFANFDAVPILERYRDTICTYNDIQGTAAVALAGILAALRITRRKLVEQRFLFLGGGSAAPGIAELISEAMALDGLPVEQARARNWLFDVNGLTVASRADLADFQKPFAHAHAPVGSFVEAVEAPRSECTAEEAYKWSGGRAVFASGSPFPPVEIGGTRLVPGQGNNVYIFPAMGMAVLATEARRVTEEMFIIAARAVAEQVTEEDLAVGLIYPPTSDILNASLHTAARIAEYVFDHDLAGVPRPDDIEAHVRSQACKPAYPAHV